MLLLGGLYDLKPLQSSFLQAEIGITDGEVAAFSPLDHRFDPEVEIDLIVGAEERSRSTTRLRRWRKKCRLRD